MGTNSIKAEAIKKATSLRHLLHQNAELSCQESKTKQILIDFLKTETDLEIVDRGSWFYAYAPAANDASPIAFRADFDALPIPEDDTLPYHSCNPDVSHRCGHDGHSASLAGFAWYVSKLRSKENSCYFIFQHAEEIGVGGKVCADLIKEKNISEIYAFHNWSGFPKGSIVIKEGTVQCASKGLTLTLTGTPAHASQPEDGANPARAIAELAEFIDDSAGFRREEGSHGGSVSYGDWNSESLLATIVGIEVGARNFGIAASKGSISATIRATREADMEAFQRSLESFAKELCKRDGLTLETSECDVFPETVNSPNTTKKAEIAAEKIGARIVHMEQPIRSSEDFGYYQKNCPGTMVYIGNGEAYPQIHTVGYDFCDDIICVVIDFFEAVCELA